MTSHATTFDDSPIFLASREVLRLAEAKGLVSGWVWNFATRQHVWSKNLRDLCGLAPEMTPSYDLLLDLVHPEDRPRLETRFDVVECGTLGNHTFRIVRPDGILRILSSRGEVFFNPDGRPRSAAATILDVTDAQLLARFRGEERRRQLAVFHQTRTWINTTAHTMASRAASEELLLLTGLTQADFQSNCLNVVVPDERSRVAATVGDLMRRGAAFSFTKRLILAEGGCGDFRFVYAPLRQENGDIQGWATIASPLGRPTQFPAGEALRGLEQGIKGEHLRAARALLDWSMADLAKASHLSLSTIRRLEENAEGPAIRNLHCVIRTLRHAGIAFVVLGSGSIAVGKT